MLSGSSAWRLLVMGTLGKDANFFPDFLNFCRIGVLKLPSGLTLSLPFSTLTPPPQAELEAAEEQLRKLKSEANR